MRIGGQRFARRLRRRRAGGSPARSVGRVALTLSGGNRLSQTKILRRSTGYGSRDPAAPAGATAPAREARGVARQRSPWRTIERSTRPALEGYERGPMAQPVSRSAPIGRAGAGQLFVQQYQYVVRNWVRFAESLRRRGSGGPKGTGRVRVPPCCSMKQRGYAKLASFCHFLLSASPPRSGTRAAAAGVAQDAPADPVRAPRPGPDRARAGSSRDSPGRGSARAESARASTLLPPARFFPAWRDSGPGAAHRAPHHGPATLWAGERRAGRDHGETCGLGDHSGTQAPHQDWAPSATRCDRV